LGGWDGVERCEGGKTWDGKKRTKTHNHRNALLPRHPDNPLKVGHTIPRIPDTLQIHRLCPVINQLGKLARLILTRSHIHKLGRHAQSRQEHLQLVVRAAVQVRGGDDVVARVRERRDGHELCALARGRGHGCDAAFEGCDALFEDVDGWLKQRREEHVSLSIRSVCGVE